MSVNCLTFWASTNSRTRHHRVALSANYTKDATLLLLGDLTLLYQRAEVGGGLQRRARQRDGADRQTALVELR